MKRFPISIDDIAGWDAVSVAAQRAAKGKRSRPEVEHFFANAEKSITRVCDALRRGHMPCGEFRQFTICDPKQRIITAAPFIDRVAHHALVAPLLWPLDSWLAHTSYACRIGKGVHAAALYAQRQCRRFDVYLKMDVRGYFEQIGHALLLALLRKRVTGKELFDLIHSVLGGYGTAEGRGLPIGALTSQQFANVFLNPADQWLQSDKRVRAHCRYMDDTIVWCDSAEVARNVYRDYQLWLAEHLSLQLKPAIIQYCRFGLGFCGYQISPHLLRPGRRRLHRCEQRLQHWQQQYRSGVIDMLELQRNTDAVFAVLQPGECRRWQQHMLERGLDGVDL